MWQIIDAAGAVRLQLPGVERGHARLRAHIEAGGTYYSTTTFEPAVFYGYTGVPRRRAATGSRARPACASSSPTAARSTSPARPRACSAAAATSGSSSLADGEQRRASTSTAASSSTASAPSYSDQANGRHVYIQARQSRTLYDADGSFVADGCTGTVVDSFAWCEDADSCGWKEQLQRVGVPRADGRRGLRPPHC